MAALPRGYGAPLHTEAPCDLIGAETTIMSFRLQHVSENPPRMSQSERTLRTVIGTSRRPPDLGVVYRSHMASFLDRNKTRFLARKRRGQHGRIGSELGFAKQIRRTTPLLPPREGGERLRVERYHTRM